MFGSLFDTNEKQLNKIWPVVEEVNSLEEEVKKLSKEEIQEKTKKWKEELLKIEDKDLENYLNKILPEAYALVREAATRTVNMRHYDVQILAGVVLHQGKIAEQKTGEGKTLTATLPIYLNSLGGKGVHLVTPNDYLSRHGAGWMGALYDYLGVSVGVIMQERAFKYDSSFQGTEFEDSYSVHLREVTRQEAYQ